MRRSKEEIARKKDEDQQAAFRRRRDLSPDEPLFEEIDNKLVPIPAKKIAQIKAERAKAMELAQIRTMEKVRFVDRLIEKGKIDSLAAKLNENAGRKMRWDAMSIISTGDQFTVDLMNDAEIDIKEVMGD